MTGRGITIRGTAAHGDASGPLWLVQVVFPLVEIDVALSLKHKNYQRQNKNNDKVDVNEELPFWITYYK